MIGKIAQIHLDRGNREFELVDDAFDSLGVQQGFVLTHAPFFNTLLSSTDLNDLN